jgi:phosphoglycolate phosphatase-like HAD superfamily hydrolase
MKGLHVVFDWDGTLSFIRAGWGEVMLRQWLEHLPSSPGESPEALRHLAHDEIWALNGRPSIHQMARLAELVAERGGAAWTADAYHDDFQRRLGVLIGGRIAAIRSGESPADHFMVRGARGFLARLSAAGAVLHVVSGTPRPSVTEEVGVLGLAAVFDGRIQGPTSLADTAFHKRGAIRGILAEAGVDPAGGLVSFGDGTVEIAETKAAGGRAVAVAADEERWHSGRTDAAKRERLAAAGADHCLADYADADGLMAWLRAGPDNA